MACPFKNYQDLHSVEQLSRISRRSEYSYTINLVSSSELLLYGLSNSIKGARKSLVKNDPGTCEKFLRWTYSLSTLLIRHGLLFQEGKLIETKQNSINLNESKGYTVFKKELIELDDFLAGFYELKSSKDEIYTESQLRLIHWVKLVYHGIESVEFYLKNIPSDYEAISDAIDSDMAREVVLGNIGKRLPCFLIEFRLMHQVQEVLFESFNMNLSQATESLVNNNLEASLDKLSRCFSVSEIILSSQEILAENLTMDDYHNFRQGLGESSGIQSEVIKKRCFNNLYPSFSKVVYNVLESYGFASGTKPKDNLGGNKFLVRMLATYSTRISLFVRRWREIHLHFPKNLLGGSVKGISTSSMIGIKDGYGTVKKMNQNALRNDPLNTLIGIADLTIADSDNQLKGAKLLMNMSAVQTQNRFFEVQDKAHLTFNNLEE